ncbi:hypothetical protein [Streptomyces sp. NPDC048462]|uniref:hypothetical protein n=1 Tax=Streptomyces sp. NPDC048462 TaxID=3365555 RepID=UPI0037135B96
MPRVAADRAGGPQDAEAVQDGRRDREAVRQKYGAGGVDPGAQRGQGAAGIGRREQFGQPCGLDELDAGDFARRQTDLGDPGVVPGAAVEYVQDLAGKRTAGAAPVLSALIQSTARP